MRIDDWIPELPEYGDTLWVARLLDERKELRAEMERANIRLFEIEEEIEAKVKKLWSEEEILGAKQKYLDTMGDFLRPAESGKTLREEVLASKALDDAVRAGMRKYPVQFEDPLNPPRS